MEFAVARWRETIDLSFELADTMFTLLDSLMNYCKKHDIPLYQEQGMWNLVNRAQSIFKQIEIVNSNLFPKLADEFSQHKKADEDFTEPGSLLKEIIRLNRISISQNPNPTFFFIIDLDHQDSE